MGRSPCCDKNGLLKKGPWTTEEDNKLVQYIQLNAPGNWKSLPKNAGLQRCGKSCRLRWTNYLRPDIKRGRFSFEEEETIIQLHSVLGNKWSAIAARLPGRTDNEIKNYWNTHIRKRFLRNGLDPVTHAPRLDLSSLVNSPQLNLSNLVQLQALLNPEVLLGLALSHGSVHNSNYQNSDVLLQKLQGNQLLNSHELQNQPQPNQFENNIIINQQTPSQTSTLSSMEGHIGQYCISHQFAEHFTPGTGTGTSTSTTESVPPLSNGVTVIDQTRGDLSEKSSYQSLNDSYSNTSSRSLSFDNSLSTSLSSRPRTNEVEMQSFCSNLLNFEIPEGLEFDDTIM